MKKINTKKLTKLLIIVGLLAVVVVLAILIAKGLKNGSVDEHDHVEESTLNVAEQELMKSSEDIYADNDFLIESFNEYEDGDKFYLAGTNLIDYDKMFVFYGELPREDIVEALAWNYEEIKDKAADDVLVVFMKGNVLYRLFNMKESECGFNFYVEDSSIWFTVQSANEDAYYITKEENGLKKHILDAFGLNEQAEKSLK